MKLLNLMAGLCIASFIVAGFMLLWILVELWQKEWVEIVVILGLVAFGFILKVLVSDREAKIKWEKERENRRLREEFYNEQGES